MVRPITPDPMIVTFVESISQNSNEESSICVNSLDVEFEEDQCGTRSVADCK
jgi:hypothetical protein